MAASPTTILAQEKGITERLKARVPGPTVEPFPDSWESYRLTHPKGAILVVYAGAKYWPPPPGDIELVVQERELRFQLCVLFRNLRGHEGGYVLLEQVRLALTGLQLPGFGKLRMVSESFLGQKDGVWSYALVVAASTVAVELDDEDQVEGVPLRRVTLAGTLSDTEVPRG